MKKTERKNKKYSPEFKISVIMDMREHHLGYRETVRKYWNVSRGQDLNYVKTVRRWDRSTFYYYLKLKGMSPTQYRTHSQAI